MPVTKTAKRALRSSKRKEDINKELMSRLEVAIRKAKAKPTSSSVKKAISLTDRAGKKNLFHKNKVSRMKSRLSKLARITPKKTSKKTKK